MTEKEEMISVLIQLSNSKYREIEEICINSGLKTSEYFIQLHEKNTIKIPSDPTILEDVEITVKNDKKKLKNKTN